jgi:nucleotide-binding universal stress UspA family protein
MLARADGLNTRVALEVCTRYTTMLYSGGASVTSGGSQGNYGVLTYAEIIHSAVLTATLVGMSVLLAWRGFYEAATVLSLSTVAGVLVVGMLLPRMNPEAAAKRTLAMSLHLLSWVAVTVVTAPTLRIGLEGGDQFIADLGIAETPVQVSSLLLVYGLNWLAVRLYTGPGRSPYEGLAGGAETTEAEVSAEGSPKAPEYIGTPFPDWVLRRTRDGLGVKIASMLAMGTAVTAVTFDTLYAGSDTATGPNLYLGFSLTLTVNLLHVLTLVAVVRFMIIGRGYWDNPRVAPGEKRAARQVFLVFATAILSTWWLQYLAGLTTNLMALTQSDIAPNKYSLAPLSMVSSIATTFNELGWVFLLAVLTTKTSGGVRFRDVSRQNPTVPALAACALVLLPVKIAIIWYYPVESEFLNVRHVVTGVFTGLVMASVVGKLDSVYLNVPPAMIGLFLVYALIQPLSLFVFVKPMFSGADSLAHFAPATLKLAALLSKVFLALVVSWLLESGRLMVYSSRVRGVVEDVDGGQEAERVEREVLLSPNGIPRAERGLIVVGFSALLHSSDASIVITNHTAKEFVVTGISGVLTTVADGPHVPEDIGFILLGARQSNGIEPFQLHRRSNMSADFVISTSGSSEEAKTKSLAITSLRFRMRDGVSEREFEVDHLFDGENMLLFNGGQGHFPLRRALLGSVSEPTEASNNRSAASKIAALLADLLHD